MTANLMLTRKQIDSRFKGVKKTAFLRPKKGWIRAIRDSLGMSTAQLAKRVGVSQPRISEIEKGEIKNTLTLESLQKVARALNCEFVYALVPNESLEKIVLSQAKKLAFERLNSVKQTMALEQQSVSNEMNSIFYDQLVNEILKKEARHLWDKV